MPYIINLANEKIALTLLSFLMLFVELTIIRWVGANIYYLFFFTNFILLASFLGMGIGFLRAKSSIHIFRYSPIFLALLIIGCYYYSFSYQAIIDPTTLNLNYTAQYFKHHLYPFWVTLPIIFLAVTIVMATIADGVARSFAKFNPLQAYRLEILGSISGIIFFTTLSFLHSPPLTWGIVITLVYSFILIRQSPKQAWFISVLQIIALTLILFIFSKDTFTPHHAWSAYYKIETQQYADKSYVVNVNGLAQQIIEPVEKRKKIKPFYLLPYQRKSALNELNHVLIIGAGTGGDVAIALAAGAKQVDAVEIDPMLYQLGKKLNPDHPYQDPRVNIFINDGRAFLQQSTKKYDMIIFALTDSLMLIPGQSSLRLENYLYTLEGITAAKNRLTENGIFTIYNYFREQWLIDRLANTLAIAFNQIPCLDTYSAKEYWATVLTVSPSVNALQCPTHWLPATDLSTAPATDNHPFIYLRDNQLSSLYIIFLSCVFIAALGLVKIAGISYKDIGNHFDLFLMGTAFLLLETKNIINFALFFGTTWFVNALVFIGILVTIYLAIETSNQVKKINSSFLFAMLIATLGLAWLLPNHLLLSLPIFWRFIAATTLAFAPIFIANLIFTDRFKQTARSIEAFGANLIGAVLGGLLEYASLIIGYRNLLVIILTLYAISILASTLLETNKKEKTIYY